MKTVVNHCIGDVNSNEIKLARILVEEIKLLGVTKGDVSKDLDWDIYADEDFYGNAYIIIEAFKAMPNEFAVVDDGDGDDELTTINVVKTGELTWKTDFIF